MDDQDIKVLLVEHDAGDVKLVRDALTEARGNRFHLDCVDRLEAGLEHLSEGGIHVVLLDLMLPDSRSLVAFRRVQEQAPEVPVVVLTGADDETLGIEALQEGAQDYLVKGQMDSALIVRTVHHAIERQRIVMTLVQQVERLNPNKPNLRNIIDNSADGIIIVDRDGIIRFANPAAEDLFGRKADELLGGFFGFPIVAGNTTELDIIRRGGQAAVAEMRVVETEWDGEISYLASLRDMTDRKRMLAELEQTRQEQLVLKDHFLSRVSHELRSPLASIHQFVTILLDGLAGGLSAEQREYLEIALRNVNQLRTMVGDLLEVTRAQTGRLTVEPRYLSLAELIPEILSNFQMSNTKGTCLSANVPSDLPPAYADPERVRQILSNLLDNAIKFTHENGTVTFRAQVSKEEPDFLCVEVTDTGCGIRPEERESIFEYLYQAENSIGSSRRGLGLGLYICKELVSRQGGRTWVESQPGSGSTFFFTLPIFSLARQLTPILTSPSPAIDSMALVTVEIFPTEKHLLTKSGDEAIQEVWKVLQSCTRPNLDVLLSRMAYMKFGEILFIASCATRDTAKVLVRGLRKQLARCDCLQDADLHSAVSFTMLDMPSMDSKQPSGEVVKAIAATMEDRTNAVLRRRRSLYEREKGSHSR